MTEEHIPAIEKMMIPMFMILCSKASIHFANHLLINVISRLFSSHLETMALTTRKSSISMFTRSKAKKTRRERH